MTGYVIKTYKIIHGLTGYISQTSIELTGIQNVKELLDQNIQHGKEDRIDRE